MFPFDQRVFCGLAVLIKLCDQELVFLRDSRLTPRIVGKLSDFRSALLPLVIFLRDIEKPENLELNSQYHEDLVQQTWESGLMSADDRSCWLAVILAYGKLESRTRDISLTFTVNSMYKISLGDGEAAYKAAITTLSLCSPVGNAAYQSLQQHHTSPQGSTRNEAPFLLAKLHLLALRKGNEAAKNRRRWGTTFEELTDILEELFERANGALLSFVALNGQDAYDVYTEVGKMFYHMSRIRLEIEETTDPVPDLQQSCLWFHAAKSIRNGTEGDAQRLFNEAKAELKQELRNEGLSTKRLKITPKYATMTVDNKQKERYPKIMQECWKEEHPHISLGRIRDYRHHTAPQGPDFPDPETFMSQWSTVPGQEQLVDDMDWQS